MVSRLRYGSTSNFEESKRKLQVRLERDYKQLASFLRTDVYYVPPAIEEGVQFSTKDLSQKHDPFRFTIRAIDQKMGLRLKKITEMCSLAKRRQDRGENEDLRLEIERPG